MAKKLLMGNAAFAHAALEAGVNVVAGYPGTPSSELVETVASLHAAGLAQGVHVEWSTNEKAALELLAGASMSGARCLFTCKQVGLNVASDALMSLNYVGIRGGLVLFVADDPGPISSQTEQDTRRFASFAKVPVLDPATPEQGFEMMKHAFELSEAYATPVIVRPTTRINHASTFFEVAESYQARPMPEGGFVRDTKWIIFPRRAYQAHGEINERLPKIAAASAEGPFNPSFQRGEDPTLGIVAGGVSAAYVQDALASLESQGAVPAYRFLQVGTPYPFPQDAALSFAEGLEHVIVFEELDHVLEDELLKLAGRHHLPLEVHGKLDATTQDRGENSQQDACERLATFFAQLTAAASLNTEEAGVPGAPAAALCATNTPSLQDRRSVAHEGEARAAEWVTAEGAPGTPAAPQVDPAARAEGPDPQPGEAGARLRSDRLNTVPDSCAAALSKHEAAQRTSEASSGAARREEDAGGPAAPQVDAAPQVEPPVRPPVLCAGCPHRGSFFAVKKAVGKHPAVFCGDIGCYTLGNAKPLEAIDTCLCMGAGITMAQGFKVADPDRTCVAFVGDSTFFASGLTGVANAVYNQHNITIVVLDNSTTAMTGSQPHPGTGATLMGGQSKPIDIEETLRALGVECVVKANPFYVESATEAAQEAIGFEGPSALIFEGPCIQLVKPERPAAVDVSACTACGKCTASIGCPAMGMADCPSAPRGRAITINPALCYGCGLCVDTCPFGALGAPVRDEGRLPYTDEPMSASSAASKAGGAHD